MLRLAAVLVAFLPFEGAAVKLHRSANVSEQCSGLFDWKACEAESTCVWEFASGACQETGYVQLFGHKMPWDYDDEDDVCHAKRQDKNKEECGRDGLPEGGGYYYADLAPEYGNWCRQFTRECVEIMRKKVGTEEWFRKDDIGKIYLPEESSHLPVHYDNLENDLVAGLGPDALQADIRDAEVDLIDLAARVTDNLSA